MTTTATAKNNKPMLLSLSLPPPTIITTIIHGICVDEWNGFVLSFLAVKTVAACSLEPVRGDCFEVIPRWYFNSRTGSCRRFSYSGCGGNDNNFQAQDECHNVCMNEKSGEGGEEGRQLGERGHGKKHHHNHDQTRPGHQHHGEEQVQKGKYCLDTLYLSMWHIAWGN